MKKFYLSTTDKKLCGVCGGIAEMFDIDPTFVRLGTVFLALVMAIIPVLIMYVIAAVIVPNKPNVQ